MYLEFYRLREPPFRLTPDPGFLFLSPSHRVALSRLERGLGDRSRVSVLLGDVGVGKTTLVQALLARMDPRAEVIVLVNPRLDFEELLESLLDEAGIDVPEGTTEQRAEGWRRFDSYCERYGIPLLLVVDEAQAMPAGCLVNLVALTTSGSHAELLLCGQPELERSLSELASRTAAETPAVRCEIAALTPEETSRYVRWRLEVAAEGKAPTIFTDRALSRISGYAGGIPRLINVLCDHCLVTGYAERKTRIDHRTVEDAIDDLETGGRPGRVDRRRRLSLGVLTRGFRRFHPREARWVRTDRPRPSSRPAKAR